jgi:AcrR family transcriptional regulator
MPKVVDVEERRSQLTDAASRLIARSGMESATMREVAAEAGWTTGALTHYFADKRELLLATFQASLANRLSLRPSDTDVDPASRLRASLEGALPLDESRRRHWMVTVAFCSQAAGDDELAETQRTAYHEFRSHVAALVRRCGLAERQHAEPMAERLIAAADGIAVQALFDPQSWPPRRQLQRLDEMLSSLGPALQRAH